MADHYAQLREFEMLLGGLVSESPQIIVDFERATLHMKVNRTWSGRLLYELRKSLSPAELEEIRQLLRRVVLFDWDDNYQGLHVYDGASWKVSYKLPGTYREIWMSNDYPRKFYLLERWLETFQKTGKD